MPAKPSAFIDTRVIYCGDNLGQLKKLPEGYADLIYIDPPFNSNRNYEMFLGRDKGKTQLRRSHKSTKAYIDYMRPRCVELHRVLKKTGSFYYHCDWHASHYVKVMPDQIFGRNQFHNEITTRWGRYLPRTLATCEKMMRVSPRELAWCRRQATPQSARSEKRKTVNDHDIVVALTCCASNDGLLRSGEPEQSPG